MIGPTRGARSRPVGAGPAGSAANLRVALVVTLTAAAAAGLYALLVADLQPSPTRVRLPALLLILAFAGAEVLVVHLRLGRSASSFSLSELPMVLGLFFAAPATLVLARVLGGGAALVWHRRQNAQKFAFNLAHFALEAVVAVAVWHALVGTGNALGPRGWLAALVAMATVDVLSSTLITLMIATTEGAPLKSTWRQVAGWGPLGALVNTSCALVLVDVLVVDWRGAWAAGVLVGVLFLAHRAYVTLEQRHDRMERLSAFTGKVGRDLELETVAHEILRQLCEQLDAELAELTLDERFAGSPLRLVGYADGTCAPGEGARSLAQTVAPGTAAPVLLSRAGRDPEARARLRRARVSDAMVAPLYDEDGHIGTLLVADRLGDVGTFADDDLTILEALANHAGVALRNARLADRLRRQAEVSEHQALHDPLTGLGNRMLFHRELQAVAGGAGCRSVILLLDLDRFKDINDTLGHHTGDRLLQDVGRRLTATAPPGTLVARIGGDEFAVLLRATPVGEAVAVAARLRAALLAPFEISGMDLTVDASIGVAAAPDHGDDAESLLQHADVAMYAAKETRCGVQVYEPEQDRSNVERLTLVTDLRSAISGRDLQVVFQPKASLRDGQVRGVEALVRWNHPQRGPVTPDQFIPIAEHTGLIDALTDLVLERSLAQVRCWRDAGTDLTVAVNLSMRSLRDVTFPERLSMALLRAGVPARALVLEITESVLMADPDRTLAVLDRLGALGVTLSIDDLGTGHSSLAYLKRLPVHEVKIDRSFVTGVTNDPDDAAIVGTIVELGHRLGKRVVAEGVEDAQAWDKLKHLGCDLAQGYWISRPRPPEQVLGWLRDEWPPACGSVRELMPA